MIEITLQSFATLPKEFDFQKKKKEMKDTSVKQF